MTYEGEVKRVLVIGSTGAMGRTVLRLADPRTTKCTAFARQLSALEGVHDDVVQGDIRDRESLATALQGMDAVLCILGGKPWRRGDRGVHEVGTRNLIAEMESAQCNRLVAVTGVGAGSSRGHGPFYYDWFARPTVLRSTYADKERQEALIESSALDWTIVRPSILVAHTPAKPVQQRTNLAKGQKMGPISREDVSRFLLNEITTPRHLRAIVHLFT